MYAFNLRTILPYLGDLRAAAATTLGLSLLTMAASLVIGMIFALARQSRSRPLRIVAALYVEFMRNVPLLVILYVVYFMLPGIGLRLSSFSAAVIGMSLNAGGYMTEILRAGLGAVPRGQHEAASSLGMRGWSIFRLILLPQVLRTIYAPLGNQFISIILASSIASAIAVNEVASWMQTAGAASFRFFETFFVAAIVYLVLCQAVNLMRIQVGRTLFRARN